MKNGLKKRLIAARAALMITTAVMIGFTASVALAHPHYLTLETAEQSVETLTGLIKEYPGDTALYVSRGDMLIILGRLDEAEKDFGKVIGEKDVESYCRLRIAEMHFLRGENDKALEALEKLEDPETDYERYILECTIHLAEKRYEKALKSVEKSLSLDEPDLSVGWLLKAMAFKGLGRDGQAADAMDRFIGELEDGAPIAYEWTVKMISNHFTPEEKRKFVERIDGILFGPETTGENKDPADQNSEK